MAATFLYIITCIPPVADPPSLVQLTPSSAVCGRLTECVTSLEERCDEFEATISELTALTKTRSLKTQRTWSVPSLPDANTTLQPYAEVDYIDATMRDSWARRLFADGEELGRRGHVIRDLRDELREERARRAAVETRLTSAAHGLDEERHVTEEQRRRIGEMEAAFAEREEARGCRGCRGCGGGGGGGGGGGSSGGGGNSDLVEHDLRDLPPHGELVRLRNGGSAYGSRESLHQLGLLDPDDCSTPRAGDGYSMSDGAAWWTDEADTTVDGARGSLLGELEAQYTVLVRKYEALLEAKSKHCIARDIATQKNYSRPPDERAAATPWNSLDLRSPVDPTKACFQHRDPQYRELFREIFDTLRRSLVQDEGASLDETVAAALPSVESPPAEEST